MDITAISIAIQMEGKTYFVALPHQRFMLLMKMAEGLSDSGRLPVVAAPASYQFMPVEEMQ
ncbi:hypothetical protein [Massilia pseudoviolaceinigra]|uniref:hypothetical protein n=1 Tax=Massilia pseudoviolaceinigra TaxID=3057165 RepID=UPI002796B4F1|nr:hypothetical protein [Massilia sp. CCM 9206]MDQ1921661.1 hypothetical protein [Massilia sp. CCM 9206]